MLIAVFAEIIILAAGIYAAAKLRKHIPPSVPLLGPKEDVMLVVADRFDLLLHPSRERAEGDIGRLAVVIESPGIDAYRIIVDAKGAIPQWLEIGEAIDGAEASRSFTGDRFFDERYAVFGPPIGIAALLDVTVRRMLQEAGRVSITRGVLTASVTASRSMAVERSLQQLIAAARRLADPLSKEERLHQIATQDPNPFVRHRAIALLAEHCRGSDAAERALWRVIEDPYVPAALHAAMALGAKVAAEPLKRLARLAASPDDVRIAAFEELLAHLPDEEMLPLLVEGARSFYGPFSRRALRWALERGGRTALIELLSSPGSTDSGNLIAYIEKAIQLARRQGVLFDPELERSILRVALDTRARLEPARARAVRAIGAFGTSSSLTALDEMGKGELRADSTLARAAREAAGQVRLRASAKEGSLSLVDDADGGELAIAGASTGSLSPTDDA
jgi:hypothetical protein